MLLFHIYMQCDSPTFLRELNLFDLIYLLEVGQALTFFIFAIFL